MRLNVTKRVFRTQEDEEEQGKEIEKEKPVRRTESDDLEAKG